LDTLHICIFGFFFTCFFVVFVAFNQAQVFKLIKLLAVTFVFSLLLNAWWIVPTFYGYLDVKDTLLEAVKSGYSQRTLTTITSFTSLVKSFSLLNYTTAPLLPLYSSNYFIVVATLLVISSIFLALRKKDRCNAFFAVLFVTSVLLSQGANKPFSNLYMFLYNYFPGFLYLEILLTFFP
jgi:hypothetical protein